jgi:hypothetical protein
LNKVHGKDKGHAQLPAENSLQREYISSARFKQKNKKNIHKDSTRFWYRRVCNTIQFVVGLPLEAHALQRRAAKKGIAVGPSFGEKNPVVGPPPGTFVAIVTSMTE